MKSILMQTCFFSVFFIYFFQKKKIKRFKKMYISSIHLPGAIKTNHPVKISMIHLLF